MPSAVVTENLTFSYNHKTSALENVSIKIEKGEHVGIAGANGAGKSTLLLNLVGILRGRGKITISGMEINDKNIKKIREKVGFVFQNPDDQLFCLTVKDDIAFGPLNMGLPPSLVEKKVKEALSLVGMEGFEERAPMHLSIGEKKRISLATILSMDPEILIFDEPSSGLDSGARKKFIDLIINLKSEKTLIIASHDLLLLEKVCSRIYLLSKGKVIAEGKPDILLRDSSLMHSACLEPL